MKTRSIARGIVGSVAALLGVMAAGCSADVAPGESADIGSTSEALVADTLDDIPHAHIGAASCVIHDTHANPAVDLLVVAGGSDGSNDVNTIEVYRPGTGWSTLGINLAQARSNLSGMQIPGSSNECIFVGGDAAGTLKKTTDRLTLNLSTGAFSIASTASQDLVTARNFFPMLQCASDKIVAFGGGDNSLEVYDPAANSGAGGWTKPATTLIDQSGGGTGSPFTGAYKKQAAVAVGTNASTTFLNFAIVGGFNGSNAVSAVDLIKMPSSCSVSSSAHIKATPSAVSLATARQLAVAFPKDPANNDDVLVTAGDSSSGLTTPLSSTEILDVDFTTTFASATKSSGTALPAVTRAPKLARLGATGAFYLIGGEDNSGTSSSKQTLASVYHYNPGVPSWTTETLNDDTSSNVQDRSAHVAEYLGTTGKIFSTAGQRIVNGSASTILTMQQTN